MQDPVIELFIDGGWVDVSDYVLHGIRLNVGRDPESPHTQHGRCSMVLYDRDRDGRWSNRVPGSVYYRKLGRNTLMRVTMESYPRCVMEIPEWEPLWDESENWVVVPVEAYGPLRRLTDGARPLRSVAYRLIMDSVNTPYRLAYWPLEEESDATVTHSPVGSTPLTVTGEVTFGAFTDSPLTERMVTFGTAGRLQAAVPTYTSTNHKVVSLWQFPEAGMTDGAVLMRFFTTGGSTISIWDLVYGTGGSLKVVGYQTTSTGSITIDTNGPWGFAVDGLHLLISVEWAETAGDIIQRISVSGPDYTGVLGQHTFTGQTMGRITDIIIGASDIAGASFGQWAVGSNITTFLNNFGAHDLTGALGVRAYAGEPAGMRILRLGEEEGVAVTSLGDLTDTAAMGPQTPNTLLELLHECETADQGFLYESRIEFGLTYRTRVDLYNQSMQLVVDYVQRMIRPPIQPSEDVSHAWNDVTTSRPDGSFARRVLETAVDPHHTLTTQPPPDGIGVYDRGDQILNVAADDQLGPTAAWIRHLGTWDEMRYPLLVLELGSPAWVANTAMTELAAALDPGDAFQVDNLPAWMPPGDVWLMHHGHTETIRPPLWTLELNCGPAQPWEVWQLDSGGSTLALAVDADDTSLKLATSAGPAWSTTGSYHLQIAGEAMTVLTVANDTVTFIGAGTGVSGNNVSLAPTPHASTAVGDTLLIFASIRNSGTGTVDLPAGWTSLAESGNVRLMGRYATGTAPDSPTVTFTGGAGGADTLAQTATFRGLSLALDGGRYGATTPSPQAQLNGTVQDIAYPALSVRRDGSVVIYLGWKLDDFTSGTSPGDAEIGEVTSVAGSDAGHIWSYDIQTTATDVAAGSFVITGGATAISRGIVLALRPLQSATVERSVNGATGSIAAGEAVHGWRLGVNAL